MAKDARALRDEAAEATSAGKYKRALAAYLELERLEPRDAQWSKRAAETYRRLGNTKNAIEAFARSADRYAQNGFLVQAIAVCKLILQIDPQHADTLRRLAQMNEQVGAGPTRTAVMAENNPALHENPNVAALRRPGRTTFSARPSTDVPAPRAHTASTNRLRGMTSTTPPITVPRTKSKPVTLPLGAALDSMNLRQEVESSHQRDESSPGIHVIPLDAGGYDDADHDDALVEVSPDDALGFEDPGPGGETLDYERMSAPVIEIEPPGIDAVEPEVDESTELELDDIEEIPLPEPRAIGVAAQRALAATPLFAGLPSEALEALVEHLELVPLQAGELLFRAGDPGDSLYVIVEGELSVQAEGPPRVEISRLGAGAFIGEVALMTDQPRSATVISLQASELLRIDRNTLSRVLGRHGDLLPAVLRFVRDRLVDRWVRTSPIFRPLDDPQRAELAARFSFLEIDGGTCVISTGTRPDGLYIVLAGCFDVVRAGTVVATLGPGDLIGETALLSGGSFRSDVMARGKALALCLPAGRFHETIMSHPHVLEYVGEHAEHSRRLEIL